MVKDYYKEPLPDDGRLSTTSVEFLANLFSNSEKDSSLFNYQTLNSQKLYFDSSDYVWIIYKDDNLGYLSLPQQNDKNKIPVRYRQNRNFVYTVGSEIIKNECNSKSPTTSLSLAYFFENFAIIKVKIYLIIVKNIYIKF